MTEADWLGQTDPEVLVAYLHGRLSNRKFRLFACACCRRIWRLLTAAYDRCLIEASERLADGLVHDLRFSIAVRRDPQVRVVVTSASHFTPDPPVAAATRGSAWAAALKVSSAARQWIR